MIPFPVMPALDAGIHVWIGNARTVIIMDARIKSGHDGIEVRVPAQRQAASPPFHVCKVGFSRPGRLTSALQMDSRSEERSVGNGWVSRCKCGWSTAVKTKKKKKPKK